MVKSRGKRNKNKQIGFLQQKKYFLAQFSVIRGRKVPIFENLVMEL
jgi:hypothetical protein